MRTTIRYGFRLVLVCLAAVLLPQYLTADDISAQYVDVGGFSGLSAAGLFLTTGLSPREYDRMIQETREERTAAGSTVQACVQDFVVGPHIKSLPTPTNLPPLVSGGESQIEGGNATGASVGACQDKNNNFVATKWTPPSNFQPQIASPAISNTTWTVAALANLPGSTFSEAFAINDSGVIVGMSIPPSSLEHAVLWSANGTITDLNNADGNSTMTLMRANAINASGQIVGQAENASFHFTAFLLDNGVATDLGNLGGTSSEALGINDSGQIVGQAQLVSNNSHAFLYANGTMTDLGTLPGGNTSNANAINASGLIIGNSSIANGTEHAVFWDANGTIHDLNDLAPNTTYTYTDAEAIDSVGDIFVQAQNKAQAQIGILLITGTAPSISANPESASATLGAPASFNITANSTVGISYQWYFTANNTTKKISGATNNTYTLAKVTTANAGNYSVVASNLFGNTTSTPGTLTVNIPPKISTQPKAPAVTSGHNATFTVSIAAGATPTVTYQWQYTSTTPANFTNIGGATSSSYTITGATSANNGSYRVLVTGSGVTVTSSAVKLTVKP